MVFQKNDIRVIVHILVHPIDFMISQMRLIMAKSDIFLCKPM